MAFNERSLDDYVDVAQRIADFRELYPSGSLQPANLHEPWKLVQVQGFEKNGDVAQQTFIVYVAAAYRTAEDRRPGIGAAWEVFPGRTNFTRGSELQNAETSAWGRAIIAVLASDSKGGVASREEVANRRAEREDGLPTNADGSLSRSRTSDAEKDAAGVMTAGQLKEHTALGGGHPKDRKTPREERAHLERITPCPTRGCLAPAGHEGDCNLDPWVTREAENRPGTVSPQQQRAIHAKCKNMGRDERLATIGDIVGRQVASSNELSYVEAARVLEKLT